MTQKEQFVYFLLLCAGLAQPLYSALNYNTVNITE